MPEPARRNRVNNKLLNDIPDDWDVPTIGEIALHVGSGATPRGGSDVYTDSGVLFIRSQNVTFDGLLLGDVAYIDERTHVQMHRSEVFPHDVLLNITGASIGRCCPLPDGLGACNVNQHVCAIRLPSSCRSDAVFLSAVLGSHIGQSQIDRLNAGGNREGLNYQQLRSFVVPWPTGGVRARISDILDVADEAIRKTEALVAKLKQMKAGLLHDLLTRGLDDHGHLRDPLAHPEQFKDSPLGPIPASWSPVTLGGVGTWYAGGTPSKSVPKYWNGTLPWVTPKDMKVFVLDDTLDHVTEAGANNGTHVVPRDTVFIVVRGMILAHTFPVCLSSKPMAFNQDVRAMVANVSADPAYLGCWFRANESRMLGLTTEATHGTKRIDMQDLRAEPITLPLVPEQKRIVQLAVAHDARTQAEESYLDKLKLAKQGLMHDLLTGRVRVKEC